MKTKRSVYNLFFNILSQIITFVLGIIIPRLFLTNLGSEANGLTASVGQIFACVGLIEAGIGATTIQALYKPIAQNDRQGINRILAASHKDYNKIGRIYMLCVAGIALIYPFIVKSGLARWQIVCVILFMGMGNAINFMLQQNYVVLLSAEGKNYIVTNLNLIVNMMTSITKAILLVRGYDIVVVTASQLIITLLRILLLRRYLRKEYSWLDFSVQPDYEALSERKYVLVQQLSYFVYSNTDIVLLTIFCDLKVVSVYTIYNLIIGVVEGIIGAFSSSIIFALGLLYNEDRKKFKKVYKIYDMGYMTLVFACFTVMYIGILPFLKLYTDGISDINYLDEKLALLFVILKMVTTLRSQSQNTVAFAGHFHQTHKSAIGEMVINLVVSIVGVWSFGIYGVLVGSIVATVYRGISVTNYASRQILEYNKKESYEKYVLWLINMFLFIVINILIRDRLPLFEEYSTLVFFFVPFSIVILVIYFVFLFLKEPVILKDIISFIKMKY